MIGSLGLVRNNSPASERHKPLELAPFGVATGTLEEDDLGIPTARFVSELLLDEVVLGGGDAKKLERLPLTCRRGNNANVPVGGLRLWENEKISEAAKK